VLANTLFSAHGDRCVSLLDAPNAKFVDRVARQVAVADADDLAFAIGAFGAQWVVVEGVGDALAVEDIEAVRVGRAGQQWADLGVFDLEDVPASAVAGAKALLVSIGVE